MSAKTKTIPFPDKVRVTKKQAAAYKKLHKVLMSIASMTGKTLGQEAVLEKRRERLCKMLWAFGLYGQLKIKPRNHIYLDGSVYLNQKITGHYETVLNYFKTLKKYGVNCKITPRVKKGWLTPMGWLRSKGKNEKQAPWFLTVFFGQKAGGSAGLKALYVYVHELKKKYGKKGLRYMMKADMNQV